MEDADLLSPGRSWKRAYSATQQHLTTPSMPADRLPEFRNSEGNHWAWLEGTDAEKVLQRFK